MTPNPMDVSKGTIPKCQCISPWLSSVCFVWVYKQTMIPRDVSVGMTTWRCEGDS